ncbi:plasmid replication-associated protein [Staphylococcus aureus]|uniref:plasmid replication-associated protein n=1 Tax=Staphylococcus aureus TaxID=1280 RepID=UPI0033650692
MESECCFTAGFLDNIDTSEVKYTENYKPVSKSTTMRVYSNKKRLNQIVLDRYASIKSIVDEVLEEFSIKNKY